MPDPGASGSSSLDLTVLRATFDEDADRYDRARPGYPAPLFNDLAGLAGTGPGCRVLEIGPGTGQATVPLARQGCRIVAVEIGARLADVARRRLAGFSGVRVEVAPFETWPLPAEPFDLVLVATAYHWLDPAVRVDKIADALRPGGALAVVETHHVAGPDTFFADVQACYEQWDPATPPGLRLPAADAVPQVADTDRSGRFQLATFRRYEWEHTYATEDYLDLLLTYSGHLALPGEARTGLLACIAALIDDRYGGRVSKRYLTQLWVARTLVAAT
jgi:SAM-dependent methyltransferase